jgi:hypothetical protein
VSARSGRYVAGSRRRKSKMPCPPGFTPVAKVDHATGVWAGVVVPRREYPPCARRRASSWSSPPAAFARRSWARARRGQRR